MAACATKPWSCGGAMCTAALSAHAPASRAAARPPGAWAAAPPHAPAPCAGAGVEARPARQGVAARRPSQLRATKQTAQQRRAPRRFWPCRRRWTPPAAAPRCCCATTASSRRAGATARPAAAPGFRRRFATPPTATCAPAAPIACCRPGCAAAAAPRRPWLLAPAARQASKHLASTNAEAQHSSGPCVQHPPLPVTRRGRAQAVSWCPRRLAPRGGRRRRRLTWNTANRQVRRCALATCTGLNLEHVLVHEADLCTGHQRRAWHGAWMHVRAIRSRGRSAASAAQKN